MNKSTKAQTVTQAVTALNSRINPDFVAPIGRSYNNDQVITLVTNKVSKIPAQAAKILEALTKADGYKLTVTQLIGTDLAGKDSALDAVGLNTVQTPSKIWQFYRKLLLDKGCITIA